MTLAVLAAIASVAALLVAHAAMQAVASSFYTPADQDWWLRSFPPRWVYIAFASAPFVIAGVGINKGARQETLNAWYLGYAFVLVATASWVGIEAYRFWLWATHAP